MNGKPINVYKRDVANERIDSSLLKAAPLVPIALPALVTKRFYEKVTGKR